MAAKKKVGKKEPESVVPVVDTKSADAIKEALNLMDPRGIGRVPSGTPNQFADAYKVLKAAAE